MINRHPVPVGDGLPPGAPRGRDARDQLAAELLAELRHYMQTSTRLVALLTGGVRNDTLSVATYVIPAEGYVSDSYGTAAGSIEVENTGTHPMTIVARPASGDGTPPAQGTGMRIIPAGQCRTTGLDSHAWTLYGTAGDVASVQVFTTGAAAARRLGLG